MNRLAFSIGGMSFALRAERADALQVPANYVPFIDADHPGPDEVAYRILSPQAQIYCAAKNTPPVWDCPTWCMTHGKDGRYCVHLRTVPNNELVTVVCMAADFSSAEIVPRAGRRADVANHALNYPYDQVLIINRLALFNAAVVHACGMAIDGKAYLFSGPSGAGKTTLARLWRAAGATLLNDDRMIVRSTHAGFTASASPWHGDEREINPGLWPLGGIFFIEHGAQNETFALDPGPAAARLMANCIAPFFLKSAVESLADLWARLLDAVPVCGLRFTPDERALETCRRWIAQADGTRSP